MKKTLPGFAFVGILIIIAVIAVAGVVGYIAYDRFLANKTIDTSEGATVNDTASHSIESMPDAPEVASESDLDKAASVLDSVDVDTSSEAQLSEIQAEIDNF